MCKKRIVTISSILLLCMVFGGAAVGEEWRVDFQGDENHGGVYGQTDPVDMTEAGVFWNIFEVGALDAAFPGPVTFTEGPMALPLLDIDEQAGTVVFTNLSDAWGWAGDGGQESQPMGGDYLIILASFGVDCDPSNWEITGLAAGSECQLTFEHATNGATNRGCNFVANGVTAQVTGGADATTATVTVTVDGNGAISGTVDSEGFNEGNWAGLVIVGTAAPLTNATKPSPENGQPDVPFNADLAWTAGITAQSHDVYLGLSLEDVTNADRNNTLGVLFSEGQTDTTLDLGNLAFGQIYYWRVDEVEGAPSFTIHKGDVWSFTVEPFARPIAGVVASTNTEVTEDQGPDKIVDGSGLDADDQHSTEPTDMWLATPSAGEPAVIEFAFDRVYKVHEMLVWNYNMMFETVLGFGVKDATVEYSENGTDWAVLGDVVLNQGLGVATYTANTAVPFDGVAAQFVRMTINSSYISTSTHGLSEVRFMYIPAHAREPQPADGAVDVAIETMLSWRAGREASSHAVNLSNDPNALAEVGTTLLNTYDLALDLDSTYYWQINEVNEAEAISLWAGDIWSFTTQEYLVVDGFESYTDDIEAGETIWQTWIDGIDDPTNGGAVVGNAQSPFAEQTIVRTGRQSMNLLFNNPSASAISEADRTFASAQDWTANGIQSLSLWFHGATGNIGRLYVKINGTKVAYDGDAGDIAIALWQPWNIDLTTSGVNVNSVTVLTIGVEGAGSGVVYIDDIRLYAETPEYITPAAPQAANLVAHYALDGNPNDSSGNGYHGVENGDPTYGDGVDGQAILLDGIDDFVDFENTENWPVGTESRSLSVWVMTSSVIDGFRVPVAYGTPAVSQAMGIAQNGTTLYGSGYGDDLVVSGFWAVDVWRHICLTYDGTMARLYADGVEIASGVKTWNLVPSRAHIGRQVNDGFEFWEGMVDEARLYDRALTVEEIAWLAGRRSSMPKPF